jgi:flagellar biosynthesis protein FliQ
MIQRIQTLYLILAIAAMTLLFFFPFAEILSGEGLVYTFEFDGLHNSDAELIYQTVPLIILISIIVGISLVSIFMYKQRITQMRLNFINMILMLGYVGLGYYYVNHFSTELKSVAVNYELYDVLPFVAALFTYLAIRAIGKDEALVRSIDRIR